MSCSWDLNAFLDPFWCVYGNGSTIYCDSRYPLNCECNMTFHADPDIAGPGVMIGFVATAWYTILVACIAAMYDTRRWWEQRNQQPSQVNSNHTSGSTSNQRPRLELFASKLLNSLCDLQLITGMAIVIAGLAQIPKISYYHEQFVSNYWNLTLNSFWAARSGYTGEDYHAKDNTKKKNTKSLRALIRMAAIFVSCVLSMAFQGIALIRENKHWDFSQSGLCYLTGDNSGAGQARFWIFGVSLYSLIVLLSIFPATEKFIKRLSERRTCVYNASKRWQKERKERYDACKASPSRSGSWNKDQLEIATNLSMLIFFALLRVFFWLLIQFLAIWSYGQGFYAFEIICYVTFAAWNMGDIIDLKVKNVHLLEGSEMKWGFGQVLTTGLLGIVIFNTIDAFRG